jgi:hypothetical protein
MNAKQKTIFGLETAITTTKTVRESIDEMLENLESRLKLAKNDFSECCVVNGLEVDGLMCKCAVCQMEDVAKDFLIELKVCRLCGGKAKLHLIGGNLFCVECTNDRGCVKTPIIFGASLAVNYWNAVLNGIPTSEEVLAFKRAFEQNWENAK